MINLLGGAHRIAIPTHMWCEKSSVLKEPHPLDLISPEPQRRSAAAAPVQFEVVSKSAVVFTLSNDTWLKTLYASTRMEKLTPSLMGTFFCNAMSQLLVPGPRKTTLPARPAM